MLNRRQFVGGVLATPFVASSASAGTPCIFDAAGFAIHGIDPVSYFADEAPISGIDQYKLRWRNAVWRFTSATTRGAFERNPHQYAPRYGGYCAVTMARGDVSETVPDAWVVHEGRLYLARSVAAIAAWKADPAEFIAQADAHWSRASCG